MVEIILIVAGLAVADMSVQSLKLARKDAMGAVGYVFALFWFIIAALMLSGGIISLLGGYNA